MQIQYKRSNRLIMQTPILTIWWPAVLLTLLSSYKYAEIYLLKPYARGLGLSNPNELSLGQLLYVLSETLFIAGVLIPALTIILFYVFNGKILSKLILCCSLFFAFLSYLSLMSLSNTGALLTWELFTDSIIQGLREPELARQYVSVSSVVKFIVVIISIVSLWYMVDKLYGSNKVSHYFKMKLGVGVFACSLVLPSAYAYAYLTSASNLKIGKDFFLLQLQALIKIEGELLTEFEGLGLHEATDLFVSEVGASVESPKDLYRGGELGSNLIIISLETGPQKVIDFDNELRFKNLRSLVEGAFVAEKHYSTYPYTSDALFSVFSSLYPNNLRRHLFTEASINRKNNLDAKQLGIFNALEKSGYKSKIYLPEESLFAPDTTMFSVFGADDIFFPKSYDSCTHKCNSTIQSLTDKFDGYGLLSASVRQAFEGKLKKDILALNEMLKDIAQMAKAGEKFSLSFLPLSSHAPWPELAHQNTLLENGKEIFLLQDDWLGQIRLALEESGIAKHTVIVVTSDHGLRTSAEYSKLEPGILNEISFHVPLIIYAPNAITSRSNIKYLTSHIDIAPSILSLLGVYDTSLYMLGKPIWDKSIEQRRTYFLADDYLGVDGYYENKKFTMYNKMTDTAFISDHMYSEGVKVSLDKEIDGQLTKKIQSNILYQKSFQGVLQNYFLEPL